MVHALAAAGPFCPLATLTVSEDDLLRCHAALPVRGIPSGNVAALRQRDIEEQDELEGRRHHGVTEEEQRLPGKP